MLLKFTCTKACELNDSLYLFQPKHVESTQVQKPVDSKSMSPNPASGKVKEDLQPSIATTK